MWYRTSTHSLFRFQDTFSDWVFISSADGAEKTDFVLVIFSWLTVVCPSKQMGSFSLLLVVMCSRWAIQFAPAKRES